MPAYELALVLRKLGKLETAKTLKRTAQNIYQAQGILLAIENLGSRPLPYAISSFGKRHREASYFLMRFDAPASSIDKLADEYKRDIDIIKSGFVRQKENEMYDCTLEEELKPPAYREDIKKMIQEGRKQERRFDMNIGLKYNPFNR